MKKRLVSDCGSADDIRTRYNRLSQHALRPSFLNGKLKRVAADLRTEGYYSQYGQDRWIAETVLPGKQAGVFVDVGAHDGVRFSNTLFLERQLNWTGLAIEPLVDVYERLVSNRTCATIRGLYCADCRDRPFPGDHGIRRDAKWFGFGAASAACATHRKGVATLRRRIERGRRAVLSTGRRSRRSQHRTRRLLEYRRRRRRILDTQQPGFWPTLNHCHRC